MFKDVEERRKKKSKRCGVTLKLETTRHNAKTNLLLQLPSSATHSCVLQLVCWLANSICRALNPTRASCSTSHIDNCVLKNNNNSKLIQQINEPPSTKKEKDDSNTQTPPHTYSKFCAQFESAFVVRPTWWIFFEPLALVALLNCTQSHHWHKCTRTHRPLLALKSQTQKNW